ncbi:MAG: 50S ribosomal protein L18 [Saprospiraceae bacterium]|nr:50S ribosomal protein L18 [Candidatus Vicinibacter affinis]MBK8403912.1 50S ribosomal protein L18 [Candidatus Vicinibacter affinis]
MKNSLEKRQSVKFRIRRKINGSPERPRLSVYKSNKFIYCQLVDDTMGHTICAATSKGLAVSKIEQAKEVGKMIAQKAMAHNISSIVFDRNGYIYHGRVKALADGAREGGLNF